MAQLIKQAPGGDLVGPREVQLSRVKGRPIFTEEEKKSLLIPAVVVDGFWGPTYVILLIGITGLLLGLWAATNEYAFSKPGNLT